MLIDPAILRAIEAPLPPEPPRMVEERVVLSSLGEAAEKIALRMISTYEAQAEAWLTRRNQIVDAYRFIEAGHADVSTLKLIDEAIDAYSFVAEQRARHRSHLAKRSARDVKAHFKQDASLGAVSRAAASKLLAVDDRIIQAVLDHVSFLRAIRADRDPDQRPGPVFENAAALRDSLTRHLSAT